MGSVSRAMACLADLARVPGGGLSTAVLLRREGKRGRDTVISLERKPRFWLGWVVGFLAVGELRM